MTTNLLVKLH